MLKYMLFILLCSINIWASSPINGYDREILKDNRVTYTQTNGSFNFEAKKIIDSDNIYNGGKVDNYDDPYIAKILERQHPFKTIKGKSRKTISIVFKDEANKKNFLEEFGLDIFKKEHLNIKLYMLDYSKVNYPLNLQVYPFFVMGDRFVQGVITKKLLKGLIEQSDYSHKQKQLSLEAFKKRIAKKYNMRDKDVDVVYNKNIELFEVREKGKKRLNSYVSKDGRYIIMPQ